MFWTGTVIYSCFCEGGGSARGAVSEWSNPVAPISSASFQHALPSANSGALGNQPAKVLYFDVDLDIR
jgi:hypothetical protein